MDIMLSNKRHWLEYDSVALLVLLTGIGLVEVEELRATLQRIVPCDAVTG
jgi:hypothetical protein